MAALAGEDYTSLATLDLTSINRCIARRVRVAWERDWWPELMRSEERFLRNTWTATAYADGDQVYHAATTAYYEANTATLSSDVPGASSKWDAVTTLDAYVGLEQTGQTAIGLVRGIYRENPEFTENPRRLTWRLGQHGIHLVDEGVPASVWVWYKIRPSEFNGSDYSSSATYAIGARKYYTSASAGFEGDFWTCAAATTAGQNPETNPEKWTRVEFPALFRPYVVNGAYADWLRGDSQTDKAMVEDQAAEQLLISAQFQALGNTPPLRWRVA